MSAAPLPFVRKQLDTTQVDVANNWLRWAADTFGARHISTFPTLAAQQAEARDLIADKCAPWFDVPALTPLRDHDYGTWYCPRCFVGYYTPGECDWHPAELLPVEVTP